MPETTDPSCPQGVPAEVWAYVLRYRPVGVTPEVREQLRPFVLEVTGKVAPQTQDTARKTLTRTTRLGAWAVDRRLPLDPEKVLTPDRVARYVEETFDGRAGASATTVRSSLEQIGRAATTHAPWPGRPTTIARTPPAGPYLPDKIAAYRRAAAVQPRRSARRCMTGVLVLCAGAGAMPGQAARATTDGLVPDAEGRWCVTLDRPDRLVPIVLDFVDDALRLAADHPGEPWLSRVPRCENWLGGVLRKVRLDTQLPPLLALRLRTTWAVGRLDAGVPLKTLVRAAGLTTAHSLSPLLPYTTHDDDAALALPAPTPMPRVPR